MRSHLGKYLTKNDYILHADMWNIEKFPTRAKVINCGLGESNLLNIAGGLARNGNNVYIYGVAGFIIHRFEQLKFSCAKFGAQYGKIVICNAGKVGYDKLGDGHKLDDDIDLMNILNVNIFQPTSLEEFNIVLDTISDYDTGMFYIQLGKDYD